MMSNGAQTDGLLNAFKPPTEEASHVGRCRRINFGQLDRRFLELWVGDQDAVWATRTKAGMCA
jgi:hypothetical protein